MEFQKVGCSGSYKYIKDVNVQITIPHGWYMERRSILSDSDPKVGGEVVGCRIIPEGITLEELDPEVEPELATLLAEKTVELEDGRFLYSIFYDRQPFGEREGSYSRFSYSYYFSFENDMAILISFYMLDTYDVAYAKAVFEPIVLSASIYET